MMSMMMGVCCSRVVTFTARSEVQTPVTTCKLIAETAREEGDYNKHDWGKEDD